MFAQRFERRVTDRSPVLICADPMDGNRETACSTLLLSEPREKSQHLLVFAYHRRPRVVAERVRDTAHETPDSLTILNLCDGDDRSVPRPDLGSSVVLERLAANNLTEVGIAVSEAIDRAENGTLDVCLGSLTTLVQYVDAETAFKFLHVLCDRLCGIDGTVHAHLDPDAVDEETVATLSSPFDSVVECQDGDWVTHEV